MFRIVKTKTKQILLPRLFFHSPAFFISSVVVWTLACLDGHVGGCAAKERGHKGRDKGNSDEDVMKHLISLSQMQELFLAGDFS